MVVGIIGAGPAGCFLGSKLKWDDSVIFERKRENGIPVQCTGIVTGAAHKILKDIPEEAIVSRIHSFRLRAPNLSFIDINLSKEDLILDRNAFDKYLAQKASDSGAQIRFSHQLKGWNVKKSSDHITSHNPEGRYFRLAFSNGKSEDIDLIVGADGPYSAVARIAGLSDARDVLPGFQARVKTRNPAQNFESGITEVLLGVGAVAWIVPESKSVARIGVVGSKGKERETALEYRELISKYIVLEDQSGPIPLYDPGQRIQQGAIALIGDAAGQVKATTYGGGIYGLNAAPMLGESWPWYDKRIRQEFGKELWISLRMRKAMNKFSKEDYDSLVRIFSAEKNKRVLAGTDRNYPSAIPLKPALREPRLWKYGLKALL